MLQNSNIQTAIEKLLSGEINKIDLGGFVPEVFKKDKIAVSVTCHEAYLKFLPDQIFAIDNQKVKPTEKFLVLDNCEIPYYMKNRTDWIIINGNWGTPNPGRNAVIDQTICDFVCFADADDIMHENYIKSVKDNLKNIDDKTAVLYADLKYLHKRTYKVPDICDYWSLRISNHISACSAWRVEALRLVGGYDLRTECYDDWSLALKLSSKGWKLLKNKDCSIQVRSHDTDRRHIKSRAGGDFQHKWLCRSYGIVTLFAGRLEMLGAWKDWLLNAELPENVSVYAVDNSNNISFSNELINVIKDLQLSAKFKSVNWFLNKTQLKNDIKFAKHAHVNNIYNDILPRVQDDMLVLFEDDVIPPYNALKNLVKKYNVVNSTGAVSAVYASRSARENLTGAWGAQKSGDDYWHNIIKYSEIKDKKTIEVDFIGGGFSLFNNGLVKKSLPLQFGYYKNKHVGGWDSDLSRCIRRSGHKILIDCETECEHLILRRG